jgi:hypothetical protein
MVYNREGYAPWSLTRKAGVQSATIDGDISVPQYIQPVLDTGFVDDKGDWKGSKSSEEQFHSFQSDLSVPNGGEILTPSAISDTKWPIDMTGYNDIMIAIKPSSGGNYSFTAVMGPDSNSFANLSPVNSAQQLSAAYVGEPSDEGWYAILYDGSQAMTADTWNIVTIYGRAKGQKLLQFKIINNSGGSSNIETAFMRLV